MLKILLVLGLAAAIFLAAAAFVASESGGLYYGSMVSGTMIHSEPDLPATVPAASKGAARLVP